MAKNGTLTLTSFVLMQTTIMLVSHIEEAMTTNAESKPP